MDAILSSRDNPLIRQVRELLGSAKARRESGLFCHRGRPAVRRRRPIRGGDHRFAVHQTGGGNLPGLLGAGGRRRPAASKFPSR